MPGQNPQLSALEEALKASLSRAEARNDGTIPNRGGKVEVEQARNDDTGRYQSEDLEAVEHVLGSAYRFDTDEIVHRFAFHAAPDDEKRNEHTSVREACKKAALHLAEVCPASYELSEAIKHLELAMFWGNASVARRS